MSTLSALLASKFGKTDMEKTSGMHDSENVWRQIIGVIAVILRHYEYIGREKFELFIVSSDL
jgi:hypothetical protein